MLKRLPALLATDSYKLGHPEQYPKGTSFLFSNMTARKNNFPSNMEGVVVFGIQYFVEYLTGLWQDTFFSRPKDEVTQEYWRYTRALGLEVDITHIEELWDLQYLPLEVRGLIEGTVAPWRVPFISINSTHPTKFAWLVTYIESLESNTIWPATMAATIGNEFYKLAKRYEVETSDMEGFSSYQFHDFGYRGQTSPESIGIGMGHLVANKGTDTLAGLWGINTYYHTLEGVAGSVPATEHSVMMMGTKEKEQETYGRLLDIYPTGIISVVSDTWDLWKVITEYVPVWKNKIMERDGKLVLRPDSGNPEEILCGIEIPKYSDMEEAKDEVEDWARQEAAEACEGAYNFGDDEYSRIVEVDNVFYKITVRIEYGRHDKTYYYIDESKVVGSKVIELTPAQKGVVRLLWEIFGGTVNSKGYRQLDSHIGTIYGDSISFKTAESIFKNLKSQGFASTNIVLGIGSDVYQHNTRDIFGLAVKVTYGEVTNPETGEVTCFQLEKNPVTDSGTKKSAKGWFYVSEEDDNSLVLHAGMDRPALRDLPNDAYVTYFRNGVKAKPYSFFEIRANLAETYTWETREV